MLPSRAIVVWVRALTQGGDGVVIEFTNIFWYHTDMHYVVVGLGNPGDEYVDTRHNVGRMVVEHFASTTNASEWKNDKIIRAHIAKGTIGKESFVLVLPDTFMNNSGRAVTPIIQSPKGAERLIVVHDDIDLPLGSLRVVFGRGSGGHRGVESIIRSVKTKDFVRLRVGVAGKTTKGFAKKPKGEKAVVDFLLKKMRAADVKEMRRMMTITDDALRAIIESGRATAMNQYNGT